MGEARGINFRLLEIPEQPWAPLHSNFLNQLPCTARTSQISQVALSKLIDHFNFANNHVNFM